MNSNAVAITGMGVVSSLGLGVNPFRDALFHGQSVFTSEKCPPLPFSLVSAKIPPFLFSDFLIGLPEDQQKSLISLARRLPVPVQIAIIASLEAYSQAELFNKHLSMAIVASAQNSSCRLQYDAHDAFQKDPEYLSPLYALNFMDTNYIGILSDVLGIRGEGFTIGGSMASGNIALINGYRLIKDGRQDACLVLGAMADLSPIEFQGFHNVGALGGHHFANEPEKACRPFDKKHEGFIYGQGVAAIILESIESAEKRGVPIQGYMLGGAMLLDGNRLTDPSLEGEKKAMQKALKDAGVSKEEVDYINTHGTSAPLGDQTELEAIETFFEKRAKQLPLNATKSITGHCLWSAGVVEAIATLIQMQDGFVHPTLNLEDPINTRLHLVKGKREEREIKIALSNSFGFGGFNSAIVLGKGSYRNKGS